MIAPVTQIHTHPYTNAWLVMLQLKFHILIHQTPTARVICIFNERIKMSHFYLLFVFYSKVIRDTELLNVSSDIENRVLLQL